MRSTTGVKELAIITVAAGVLVNTTACNAAGATETASEAGVGLTFRGTGSGVMLAIQKWAAIIAAALASSSSTLCILVHRFRRNHGTARHAGYALGLTPQQVKRLLLASTSREAR